MSGSSGKAVWRMRTVPQTAGVSVGWFQKLLSALWPFWSQWFASFIRGHHSTLSFHATVFLQNDSTSSFLKRGNRNLRQTKHSAKRLPGYPVFCGSSTRATPKLPQREARPIFLYSQCLNRGVPSEDITQESSAPCGSCVLSVFSSI